MPKSAKQIVYLGIVISFLLSSIGVVLAGEQVFTETFDHQALPGWDHSPGVFVEDGILTVEPNSFLNRAGDWGDMTLTVRLWKGGQGEIVISYRTRGINAYHLVLGPNFILSHREAGENFSELAARSPVDIPTEEWFEVEIRVTGGKHRFLVNGELMLDSLDENPLEPGGVAFSTLDEVVLEVDELTILFEGEAPQLEIEQVPSATPTSEGSETPPEDVPQLEDVELPVIQGFPAYQANSWVRLGGPPGGIGYDIRHSFSDSNFWYVTDTSSGFHISADRGLTWQRSNQGIQSDPFGGYHIFTVAADPHDPKIIWAGTRDSGHIYRSADGGGTWVDLTGLATTGGGVAYRGFTVDPRTSDIVYAMAEVTDYVFRDEGEMSEYDPRARDFAGGRIFKTEDSGLTWTRIWQGPALARYLWINPDNPDELYASTGIFDRQALDFPLEGVNAMNCGGVGVLKSVDGGSTWDWIGFEEGLTHLTIGSLYMHPQDPKTLLAGGGSDMCQAGPELSNGERVHRHGGVYLTQDGGETWSVVVKDDIITSVEFCAQNPQIAYAAGKTNVYRSEDGGLTWDRFGDSVRQTWGPSGLQPGTPIDIQTDPTDCNRVFINNYDGGNFFSMDGGKTWNNASQGYSGAFVWELYVFPDDAEHILAATGMAPWESLDGGLTWRGLSNPYLMRGAITLAVDPSDTGHWLVQGGSQVIPFGGIYETHDRGAIWIEVRPALEKARFAKIVFAPSDPKMIYAAASTPEHMNNIRPEHGFIGNGVFRSIDGGTTWQPPTDPQIMDKFFVGLAVSPTDPHTVFAGTFFNGGIFKSTDGGVSWTPISQGLSPQPGNFSTIAIDPEGILYAGGDSGLYRSADQGENWVQLTTGLDPAANFSDILFDPTNPDTVYAASHNMGIYVSVNGGEQWQPLNQGLVLPPGVHLRVYSLDISSDGSVLYAGSESFGVFRLGPPTGTTPPEETSEPSAAEPTEEPAPPTKEPVVEPTATEPPEEPESDGGLPCIGGALPVAFIGLFWLERCRRLERL